MLFKYSIFLYSQSSLYIRACIIVLNFPPCVKKTEKVDCSRPSRHGGRERGWSVSVINSLPPILVAAKNISID